MKKILLIAAVMACVVAKAQGTVYFKNNVPGLFSAPVFMLDGVTKLAGDGYYAQLYASIGGSFNPIGAPTPFLTDGFVDGGVVTIPAVGVVDGVAILQMRSWQVATAGTAGTYEEAITSGRFFHQSESFSVTPGNPLSDPPGEPAYLVGLAVPEPSIVALCFIGGAALLFRRREA